MILNINTYYILILVLTLTISSTTCLKKFKTKDNCFTPNTSSYIFNNDWSFKNGSPVLSFKAMGNNIRIILADEKDENTAKYTVIIAGWNNTRSKVTSGRTVICDFPESAKLDTFAEYKIFFSSRKDSISLVVDDNVAWTCEDNDGFNADSDGYFGFSALIGHSPKICDVDIGDYVEHQPHAHLTMTKTVR
jgi:hypothetical protein